MRNGFYDLLSHWDAPYGSPRLWCMLAIEYADGTAATVATDGLWRAAPSAILADGPFTGEVYDARLEHPGWSEPSYDDSHWQKAVQRLPPLGPLTPQTVDADAVTATYRPSRLEPDSLRPLVEAALADECRSHGKHIFTGMYAGRHLGEVLADAGAADLAIAMLTQRDYPSFGHMLAQGAKTTWEQWNGENSHNHPMQGGILTFVNTRLAGLRPLEGGYRHFEVRPAASDSVYTISYSYQCPYGTIDVEYSSGGAAGASYLKVTVPVGCTAEAYLSRRGRQPLHRTLAQGRHTLVE